VVGVVSTAHVVLVGHAGQPRQFVIAVGLGSKSLLIVKEPISEWSSEVAAYTRHAQRWR
jgi:hypothetical protein